MRGPREDATMSEGAKHVLIQWSILGLLALAALGAILLLAGAGRADGASAPGLPVDIAEAEIRQAEALRRWEELAVRRPPESRCRWELVTLVPPERYRALLELDGPAGWAIEARQPVLLLDQCSGRTWELGFRPGPGGYDWRLLRREGVD